MTDLFTNHYHNTVPVQGKELKEYQAKAASQDAVILELFQSGVKLTPDEARELLIRQKKIGASTPITSVRRAISNLVRDNKLKETGEKRAGNYGRSTNVYEVT